MTKKYALIQMVKIRNDPNLCLSCEERQQIARRAIQTKRALNLSRRGTYLAQEKKIC